MKKTTLPIIAFATTFIICYFCICFLIPAFRIKLAAEPMEYFIESLKHMAMVKSIISIFIAIIAGVVASIIGKKRQQQ